MRKKILFLFLTAFLAGCTQDPVSSGDIKYREIRVDAFSNYWLTERLNAEDVDGNILIREDGTVLELLEPSYDKSSSLPAHVVKTDNGSNRVYYKAEGEPTTYSCYRHYQGIVFSPDTLNVDAIMSETAVDGDGELILPSLFTNLIETNDGDVWFSDACRYYPGKGFYFPAYQDHGEYLVRY